MASTDSNQPQDQPQNDEQNALPAGTPEAEPAAAEPLDGSAEPARPVTKRAPRKSSRKAAAPVAAVVADPFALAPAAQDPAAETVADVEQGSPTAPSPDTGDGTTATDEITPEASTQPSQRARRSRKAAKRAAPAPAEQQTAGATDDLSVVPDGPVPAAAAATEAVRADDLASDSAPDTDSVADIAVDTATDTDDAAQAATDTESATDAAADGEVEDRRDLDDAAEAAELAPGGLPSGGAASPATVPSFGLLFQPPEPPPAPRRRRASSPAAAPASRAEEPEVTAREDRDRFQDATNDAPPRPQREAAAGDVAPQDEPDGDAVIADDDSSAEVRRRRRRGGKGRRGRASADSSAGRTDEDDAGVDDADTARPAGDTADDIDTDPADQGQGGGDDEDQSERDDGAGQGSSRRRTRRRRRGAGDDAEQPTARTREPRQSESADRPERSARDEVTSVRGSTRLEAKKQRRREGREAGRRRTVITEAEFLARRESVERVMVVRHRDDRTQIGVLEDGILVEHYVSRETNASMAGNIYLGRVQNVLPSMEAAFLDVGRGRNAVLYAGEVNWDAAGLDPNRPRRIEHALKSGDSVLVQVTKDPIGHKGARLTSQISLPGRYLVYVPGASMTGISRKLPDTERARLKRILREVVPEHAGVIVRTAAEGASEEELRADVARLTAAWEDLQAKAATINAPALVHGEPDLTVRVIRDVFNEDFTSLVAAGEPAWAAVSGYVNAVAPDLADRLSKWTGEQDAFTHYRVDEQLAKALDRKVWLPSGGSLVIDRTEAMTVIDVNTGKFIGSGGNLEETVTKNNIEAAEEIVRQLRLRDIGGIIVIDFIDMVLESNRDLVVRRLTECLGRDRTKHQVAEVTSLGLVQMTRKRVGSGLLEIFSEPCEHCAGRGVIVHSDPVDKPVEDESEGPQGRGQNGAARGGGRRARPQTREAAPSAPPASVPSGPTAAQIAAKAHAAAIHAAALSGTSAGDPEAVEGGISVAPTDDDTATTGPAVTEDLAEDVPLQGSPSGHDEAQAATPDPAQDEPQQPLAALVNEPPTAPTGSDEAQSADAESDETGSDDAEDAIAAGTESPRNDIASDAPVDHGQPGPDVPEQVLNGRVAEAPRPRRRRGRVVAPAGPPRPHPGGPPAAGAGGGEFGPGGADPVR